MKNSPPAEPHELRIRVHIYKKQTAEERKASGQKDFSFKLLRKPLIKESRQRSTNDVISHLNAEVFQSRFIGNWWEFKDVQPGDIIVIKNNLAQFELRGPVVNWEQRNRWAVIDVAAFKTCLKESGINSCYC